ncbi:MAG: magnesium/cobalt efflux protein [Acidiferrobacteraceae bacterium]|nr:magnesium/cobalt efflux protein [Acidiferrobacteraceae bacterium]
MHRFNQDSISLLSRLSYFFRPIPKTREQLFDLLNSARRRNLIDENSLPMMHRIVRVSELQVDQVMVARAQMVTIDSSDPFSAILPMVVDSAHSRFPVIDGDMDEILGILLAKDLLRHTAESVDDRFPLEKFLRPPIFIPGSKRLSVLLQEFRDSRNHMAIVVDEYGGVVGLITIEDVLEEIVGYIEDETDEDEEKKMVLRRDKDAWVIRSELPISRFNKLFDMDLDDRAFDTIGGLITQQLGHVPRRGERIMINDRRIEVIGADGRRARLLRVNIVPNYN